MSGNTSTGSSRGDGDDTSPRDGGESPRVATKEDLEADCKRKIYDLTAEFERNVEKERTLHGALRRYKMRKDDLLAITDGDWEHVENHTMNTFMDEDLCDKYDCLTGGDDGEAFYQHARLGVHISKDVGEAINTMMEEKNDDDSYKYATLSDVVKTFPDRVQEILGANGQSRHCKKARRLAVLCNRTDGIPVVEWVDAMSGTTVQLDKLQSNCADLRIRGSTVKPWVTLFYEQLDDIFPRFKNFCKGMTTAKDWCDEDHRNMIDTQCDDFLKRVQTKIDDATTDADTKTALQTMLNNLKLVFDEDESQTRVKELRNELTLTF